MPNALLTGVSGLLAHQRTLDVVGHNIANINTTGYKTQRVLFSDLLYQTIRPATSAGEGDAGGTNPMQIGGGVKIGQIDRRFGQGSLELTGGTFDFAIDGNGFFVLNDGNRDVYTRAGAFALDSNGILVDAATGNRVMRIGDVGEGSDTLPAFQTSGSREINIPFGASIPGEATTTVEMSGNLDNFSARTEMLRSITPFLDAAGDPADSSTLLNGLQSNSSDYVAGDVIHIRGTDADGTSINQPFTVSGTTTLDDLVNEINSHFTQATAQLDSAGNLVIEANEPGEASLTLGIVDDAAKTDFTKHQMKLMVDGEGTKSTSYTVEVFDVQGGSHLMNVVFEKESDNVWNMTLTMDPSEGTVTDGLVSQIVFNEDGTFQRVLGSGLGDSSITLEFNGILTPQNIDFSFGSQETFGGLTQFAADSALRAEKDGFGPGSLAGINVSADGILQGVATNGRVFPVAQLALVSFQNSKGLTALGDNNYEQSTNSGDAELGTALSGGRGSVVSGQLEGSNVDIAFEFTRLIVAQRGFSANARTITVSDEVLEELTNIIR